MILSRIAKILPSSAFVMGSVYRFAKIKDFDLASYEKEKKLSKVSSVKTVFKGAFSEKQITVKDALVYASRATELIQKGDYFVFNEVITFLKQISSLNFDALTKIQIRTFLRFLNRVESRFFHQAMIIINIKTALGNRLSELLNNAYLESEENINELISFYYYFANERYGFRIIDTTILPAIFNQCKQLFLQQRLDKIQYLSIFSFFNGFQKKIFHLNTEKQIRIIFLSKIKENIETIPLADLIKICIELKNMDHYDLDQLNQDIISIAFKKLASEVPNLELKQIKKLFSMETNKYNVITLLPVYKEIIGLLFQRIEVDGVSQISDEIILQIFKKSSKKLNFKKHFTSEQQSKMFAFMNRFALDHKNSSDLNSCLIALIRDQFLLVNEEKEKIDFLLKEMENNITVGLLYELDCNQYDIKPLLSKIKYNIKQLGFINIARYSIILKKLINNQANTNEYSKKFEIVYATLAQQFSTVDNFCKSITQLINYDQSGMFLGYLTEIFPQLFTKQPNPFELTPQNSNYTIRYLEFIYLGKYKSQQFIINFQKNFENKITNNLLFKVIGRDFLQAKNNFFPHQELIKLLSNRIKQIIMERSKKDMRDLFFYLGKLFPLLLNNTLNYNTSSDVWRIFFQILYHRQSIKNIGVKAELFLFLSIFFCKYKKYQNKPNYKKFVSILFSNLNFFIDSSFHMDIIKECFRMNMVTKDNCSIISEQIKEKLNARDLSKYKTITDENYIPQFHKDKKNDLQLLIYNPRAIKIIEENMETIEKQLNEYSVDNLQTLILNFNQPNNSTSLKLVQIIMKNLANKNVEFDSFDIFGVFQVINSRNWITLKEVQLLFENIIKYFTLSPITFENLDFKIICQLINYSAHLNPQKVPALSSLFVLIQNWMRKNVNLLGKCQILVHLLHTCFNFSTEHLYFILKMVEFQPKLGLKFFLFLEESYSDNSKKSIAKLIASKINKFKPQSFLNDWFYLYLKEKYPNETSSMKINVSSLPEFIFTSKPHPSTLETLKSIGQALKLDFTPLQSFGKNQAFKFNNKIVMIVPLFLTLKNPTSNFILRTIKEMKKIDLPVFFIANSQDQLKSKLKCSLLTNEQLQQLQGTKGFEQYFNSSKQQHQ